MSKTQIPVIPITFARRAWRNHITEMWRNLHNIRTSMELRAWADGVPIMMAVNSHIASFGAVAVLDMSSRDMYFYGPDGHVIDHWRCGHLIYRAVVKDQNEGVIPKFWE